MAEKKIKGRTFRFDGMLATEALLLKMRVLKMIGDVNVARFQDMLAGFGDKGPALKEKSNAAAIAAFGDIIQRLDPDDVVALIGQLVAKTKIQRPSGVYEVADLDGDFSDDLAAAYEVVLFVLGETFGGFFTAVQATTNPAVKRKR